MTTDKKAAVERFLTCACGNTPSTSEKPGTGTYMEGGELKYVCLTCWQHECYEKIIE